MSFSRTYVEKEETCPGGGAMRYVVEVSEPDRSIGEENFFVSIEEGSTAHGEKESMLLDVQAVGWLVGVLQEALAYAATEKRLRRR